MLPEWTWEWWQWRGTLHSPKLRHHRNLTIRLFNVIFRTLVSVYVCGGSYTLCRGAVSVFYSPSRLSKVWLGLVLWHINHYWLFNAESCFYINIKYIWFVIIYQNTIDRWTKECIFPFPKKGDLGLAKIYNALLCNCIEPKIENILRKNQNGFQRNRSTTSQILTIHRILEAVRAKNLEATILFVDFAKPFDFIHRGKYPSLTAYPKKPLQP